MILSNSLPKLLLNVILLSLQHCPFFPFPLYIQIILPCFHSCGISSVLYMLLNMVRIFFLILSPDSIRASFGMSSGPTAFRLWSCLIAESSSYFVISLQLSPAERLVTASTVFSICFVHSCIVVLYCIMRPYTDGPIRPLSYRHSSGVVRNPHSALAE